MRVRGLSRNFRRAGDGVIPFSPRRLFGLGEQGAWFDPSDFSTLFQDSAGTTPVTAVEQPVGKMLDKSGRGNHAIQATTTNRPILKQDANGKYYLLFDGIDDGMQTSAIDFTATDKMSVFAGVRKLSDAGAVVCELSASIGSNSGTFIHAAGNIIGGFWATAARGSNGLVGGLVSNSSVFTAPDLAIISGLHDISGDSTITRRNTVAFSTAAGDKGTGNFGSYPLYIGRRGGSTNPLNGYFYGLIIRGALSTDSQIAAAEKWLANKTGVVL